MEDILNDNDDFKYKALDLNDECGGSNDEQDFESS
tara:strand:+ start:513 stop:617 length:105 start_codon:yes stop_codon:yes gene_type:complete